ncbi:MAG: hypothetical protein H7X79_04825 [Sporomusaceae bacterium]|nr:hypothetical protein [Sporomusaceae bacterium]
MKIERPKTDHLLEQVERLTRHLEALRIAEYIELLEKPWKLITTNFIAGIARGLGFAIGTTIIFAIVVDSLRRVILINIPIINDYLIEIFKFIDLKK